MAHGARRVAELGLKIKEIKLILMHYFYLAFQQYDVQNPYHYKAILLTAVWLAGFYTTIFSSPVFINKCFR